MDLFFFSFLVWITCFSESDFHHHHHYHQVWSTVLLKALAEKRRFPIVQEPHLCRMSDTTETKDLDNRFIHFSDDFIQRWESEGWGSETGAVCGYRVSNSGFNLQDWPCSGHAYEEDGYGNNGPDLRHEVGIHPGHSLGLDHTSVRWFGIVHLPSRSCKVQANLKNLKETHIRTCRSPHMQ